ncbi:MAG TPA: DUF1631 family protein [Arenimonas sp.]|nr:DUF1631 family protein [Arenimonas sp.]
MNNESGITSAGRPFPGHDSLFAQVSNVSRKHLSDILHKSIAAADVFLYDICQQDQATIGSPNIENLRMLRSASQSMELQFSKAVEIRFAQFQALMRPIAKIDMDLSLVEIDDTDDVVSTELVSEALTRAFVDSVSITSQRFCALFGFLQTEKSKTPLTEKHIAEFMRSAMHGIDLSPKVRAIVFRNYEEVLLDSMAAMLDDVNRPMVSAGILPHLSHLKAARRPVASSNGGSTAQAAASDQRRHAAQHNPEMQLGVAENALFEEICNYLHSLRPQVPQMAQSGGSMGQVSSRHQLSTHEMISVLSILQSAIPASITNAMKGADASIAMMLKSEMLSNTRKIGLPSEAIEIKREDEDAVDLVGMLFDVLMSERDFRDEAKTLISRLVVPYTKAAVLDRRLFLTKAHPARKLLNALTEAIEGNHGDGPQERELLNKAENTVDQLVAGFNEDIAIFEMLEHELRTYLDQHRRRIDLAEKRAKEAQRGQERLENARMLAARELEARTNNAELPAVIQDFFSRYWTHHLSMIALREGEESQAWTTAIKVADDAIAVLNSEPAEARTEQMMKMRPCFDSVLASSGVLADSSGALVRKIADSARQYSAHQAPVARIVAALPEQESVLSESSLRLVFNKDALNYDEADAEFFKSLAIGTWLQLEGSDGGYSPIKLAWVSPISSRLMFVNRRGVRVLVVSVEELAQMKKQGKLIVHAQDNVFEQTMDRVLNRLKTDFG